MERTGGGGGRKRRVRFSKLYSFACGKKAMKNEEMSEIGNPGFSRMVYCNEPECFEAGIRGYPHNYVSTTKYNPATFVPKSLFEQFRRVANFYFLVTALLSFTPIAPFTPISTVLPLCIVITATIVKEGAEDLRRRRQDIEMNNRKVKVHQRDGVFHSTEWKNLKVGDIVKVQKDGYFPADLLLLSSSYEDAICYVETMNLDGETNLKVKQSMEVTASLQEDSNFRDFKAIIKCEDPNPNLYNFVGTLEFEEQQYSLSPQQILLRESKLRNTDYVYGAVIFTGHDTKVMQNATGPPSKRSRIERKMDKIIYVLFAFLITMAFIGSIVFGVETSDDIENGRMTRWYLRPDSTTSLFDPDNATLAAILHFLTALMLYNYFIPISLYIQIEVVKLLQTLFINRDIQMYHEESDTPANTRTSNLNEELGQIDTILSDKTGTLTCNSMEFLKCSIAGTAYGRGVTEIERAMQARNGHGNTNGIDHIEDSVGTKSPIKGFNFKDGRVMNGKWVKEPRADVIQKFFRLLAVCHTAIPDVDDTGKVTYEAESPDEAAFVIAAREFGFEFYKRTQTSISTHELDPRTGRKVERVYELLNVLEFNSTRKRMTVIVRDEEGKILVLCKGADSVMFERIGKNGKEFEEETKEHVNQYADSGLRTLILAYRELDEERYNELNEKLTEAKNSVSVDREKKLEAVAEKIERDLILLGATAVEDKLQDGVPQCIYNLAQAGIKLWVLTGDKMETAINIGFACSLLRQGMKQIIINLESPEIQALEKVGDRDSIAKASKESVLRQITVGKFQLIPSSGSSEEFALIIDGKSLAYALEDDVKHLFLELALSCASVICCRSSPKQKALVTRLVKEGTGKTTLGIGDGANDVGMLQEADIGIGISGVEGMQAVMASDVSIAQFKYLERLLLVHGHWCYRRLSTVLCYFFYKNITFGFTIFLYEAFTSFSGTAAYNDWYMAFYSVLFTSLPVMSMGVFDQDVSARNCLKYPKLYQEGIHDILFKWRRILGWMLNGILSAIIIFFFCFGALGQQAFRDDGFTVGRDIYGAAMCTCVLFVVNLQMAIAVSFFTLIQHICIWGSLTIWFLYLIIYGSTSPLSSTTAYKILTETLAPAPIYYFLIILVAITALIPYFSYTAIQRRFFPTEHEIIQLMRAEEKSNDTRTARNAAITI